MLYLGKYVEFFYGFPSVRIMAKISDVQHNVQLGEKMI